MVFLKAQVHKKLIVKRGVRFNVFGAPAGTLTLRLHKNIYSYMRACMRTFNSIVHVRINIKYFFHTHVPAEIHNKIL